MTETAQQEVDRLKRELEAKQAALQNSGAKVVDIRPQARPICSSSVSFRPTKIHRKFGRGR